MIVARPGRLALAGLLALAAAAAVWRPMRERAPASSGDLKIQRLADRGVAGDVVRLLGVWDLTSEDGRFGGYSAMIPLPGGRLWAFTDSSKWLEFRPPADGIEVEPVFGAVGNTAGKRANDVEGATYDPGGTVWLSLEGTNAIWRFGPIQLPIRKIHPPGMAGFPENGGAESIVRLSDGRFIVLRETGDPLHSTRRTALLFARDPIEDDRAVEFFLEPPAGFDPTDAAVLPDGRVLILLRSLTLAGFPPFASRLVVADPADIRPGQVWPWKPVADLSDYAPRENYEGLAVVPTSDGVRLWLISDSNDAVLVQRTLLVELEWLGGSRQNEAATAHAASQ